MGHDEDISRAFADFETQLKDILANFYNPMVSPAEPLWQVLGCDPGQGIEPVWKAILRGIEELKPALETPTEARGWRLYQLLSLRYARQLTQEKTAEQMGITARHLRREQQHAIHLLARRLWDQRISVKTHTEREPATSSDEAWRSQVRQEIDSLQHNMPGAVSNLAERLTRAIELSQNILKHHHISLIQPPELPVTLVEVHPSLLNQILLGSLAALASAAPGATLTAASQPLDSHILLRLEAGRPVVVHLPELVRELARLGGLPIQSVVTDIGAAIELDLPTAHERMVLVVDDNLDLVHFYRRYVTNTRYTIVHLEDDQDIFQRIAEIDPDVIVLDVMLPDVDGWELLSRLQQNTTTRPIPIVICSVTQGQELARSLGAALYVQKPVGRRDFLAALDQALAGA